MALMHFELRFVKLCLIITVVYSNFRALDLITGIGKKYITGSGDRVIRFVDDNIVRADFLIPAQHADVAGHADRLGVIAGDCLRFNASFAHRDVVGGLKQD